MIKDPNERTGHEGRVSQRDHYFATVLAQLAQRHIDRMRTGWPERAWSEPRVVVRGCQDYGLGLIRMLGEYYAVAGIEDRLTVRLATELDAECGHALRRLKTLALSDAQLPRAGRPGARWRAGTGRAGTWLARA